MFGLCQRNAIKIHFSKILMVILILQSTSCVTWQLEKRTYMLLNKICTCPSCSFHRCCFVTNWLTAQWVPIESVNRSTSCHLSLWHVTWEVPINRAWGLESQAVGLIFFGPVISHWAHLPHYTISQCSPLRTEEVEKNISRQRIITC